MAIALDSAELKIYVYSGSIDTYGDSDLKYTLKKTKLKNEDIIVFEISELVKDYVDVEFKGDYENAKLTAFVTTELTRTFKDDADTTRSDPSPLKRTYVAFRGYGELFDQDIISKSYVNPTLPNFFLFSNDTIFHKKGETLHVPVYNTEEGVYQIKYFEGSVIAETQAFGSIEFITSDTVRIRTDLQRDDTYDTTTTAVRVSTSDKTKTDSTITKDTVTKMQAFGYNGSIETKFVRYIDECKFNPYKITFLNKFGALQDLWFFKRRDNQINIEKENYRHSTLNYENNTVNYNPFEHVNKSLTIQGKKSMTLNTGFVTDDHNEVIKQLLLSEFVWIHEDGLPQPVKPKNLSFVDKLAVNEKVINFTLDFEYAHNTIQDIR